MYSILLDSTSIFAVSLLIPSCNHKTFAPIFIVSSAISRASLEGYEWLKKHMIDSDRGQARMKKVAELMNIAEELGESLSKIAIAWCLLNENVSTIILGASKIEQLEENLKAPEVLPLLTEEVQKRLGSI